MLRCGPVLFALGLAGSGCGLAVVPVIVLALGLNPSNSDDDAGDVAVLVVLPTLLHPSSFLSWYWKGIGGKFTKYSTTAANALAIKLATSTPSSKGGKGGRSNSNPNGSFGGESDDVGAPTPTSWTGSVGGSVARALCVRRVVSRVVRRVVVGTDDAKGACEVSLV